MKHKHNSVRLDLSDCLLSTAIYDVEIVGACCRLYELTSMMQPTVVYWTSIADPVIYIR